MSPSAQTASIAPLDELARPLRGLDPAPEDALLEAFLAYTGSLGLSLYPAQEEALLELFAGRHVILNTPTGSGKSLVALAAHFRSLVRNERSYYTAPIKALVSEKFFDLCRALGPRNVGMMTGDATVNRDAPVVCCTAEILANLALREGKRADVASVVMDEFHFYSDPDRGIAWQLPLLELPQSNFLLMSATLGEVDFFASDLEARTGRPVAVVRGAERPVPLLFEYRETPIHETISDLLSGAQAPVYIVHFSQRAASERAQSLMSVDILSKEEKRAIKEALHGFRFDTPYGKDLRRFVHHGVGVHHAGILPKYRRMVERLAQAGQLKLICGTDTLGVGVNVPIRSVLFTQLCKYDGRKTALLSVRDFQQIAGRAGRKGYDDTGYVLAQAPEHVIENLTQERKAAGDAKKLRKLVRKKPPERGYAHWDKGVFERLTSGTPEPLRSSFAVSHSLLLQILQRSDEDGCLALRELLRDCHEPDRQKRQHGRQAIQLLRSLLELGVIASGSEGGSASAKTLKVSTSLQEDFSLNQTLSLWVVETLSKLDATDPEYPLNVVTLVESVLENPAAVLVKQLDKLKKEVVDRLKAEGVEYEARIEALDALEYPKPLREFVYDSYNDFAARQPWVGENIRPKSIVRDMYENAMGFRDYVKEYGLLRSEGVLLRYLSDAYRALVQTVPEDHKTDEVYDLTEWLEATVRQVDASLLQEWEQLMDPGASDEIQPVASEEATSSDITQSPERFRALLRSVSFRLVRWAALQNWTRFREELANHKEWSEAKLEAAFADYFREYPSIRIDADARAKHRIQIQLPKDEPTGHIEQTVLDPEGHGEWRIRLRVDLAASAADNAPALHLDSISSEPLP